MMPKTAWDMPVIIQIPENGHQTVHGPFAALIFLLNHWPDVKGPTYHRAKSVCVAALEGEKTPEEAQEAFARAAEQAKILFGDCRRQRLNCFEVEAS